MTLVLPAALREAIVEHAREGAPEEVVGVLAGERRRPVGDAPGDSGDLDETDGTDAADETAATDEALSVVERRYPAENAATSPEARYEIAPAEELTLLERVDDDGLDVVGFYHSHPRGPVGPSETDARLAAWPGRSYVIVSLAGADPTVGSWRWTGERFRREAVDVR